MKSKVLYRPRTTPDLSKDKHHCPSSGVMAKKWTFWTPISYAIFHVYAIHSRCSNHTIPLGTKSRHVESPARTNFGQT